MLVDRGSLGATFTEARTAPPASRTLVVTFDDAPQSIAKLTMPIMGKLGLPGTVFVPTSFPDNGRPMAWPGQEDWIGTEHERELACMSWAELRELADRGWEIGSHTRSHPRLTAVGDGPLQEELRGSRADCEEHLGRPCRSLAYPYSDFNADVVRAAREAGYLLAGIERGEPVAPLPLQWPGVLASRRETARRLAIRIWRRQSLTGSPLARGVDAVLRSARRVFPR
jgi:peptidoglycan/xylan/chitin deacetylase (PgdA/CDA1 family)